MARGAMSWMDEMRWEGLWRCMGAGSDAGEWKSALSPVIDLLQIWKGVVRAEYNGKTWFG